MGADSKIAWTHHTFNPWIGCTKVSAECANCYAESLMDKRWGKVKWGPKGERQKTSESNWRQPFKWDKAAEKAGEQHRVFCASLADVCEDRPELVEWRRELLSVVYKTPNLDWLFLTKRPENYLRMMVEAGLYAVENPDLPCPQPNIWVGTSVGVEATVSRVDALYQCPAAIRFISVEPLLEPVYLPLRTCEFCGKGVVDCFERPAYSCPHCDRQGLWGPKKIDWVIVGCESNGSRAGRFADGYETSARSILRQCRIAGAAFFHKQMPINGRVSHDPSEWPEDLRVRQFPNTKPEVATA